MHSTPSESVHGCPATRSHDQLVVHPTRDQYLSLVSALRADGFEMCVDLCCVDYFGFEPKGRISAPTPDGTELGRFELVVNLLSVSAHKRIRLRVQVPESDPRVPSIIDVYPGADAFEREAYDMLGVIFEGHPDMSRILMPEDWEGHPLRKDFAVGNVPVQFKAARQTS